MKTVTAALLAFTLLLPVTARAQIEVRIGVPLPPAPRLVVVSPGVQVVEDLDEEVFFSAGFYWTRQHGRWYRARNPRMAFVPVEPRHVPAGLRRLPPGHYRHYRRAPGPERHHKAKHEDRGRGEARGRGHDHGRGHNRH